MSEMISVKPMTVADIPAALNIWRNQPGITLRDADSPEALAQYLERNPGCSFIIREHDVVVGAALAGHDGRRAFIHHVLIKESHRLRGLGRRLVNACMEALIQQGMFKCHILVDADNETGKIFWKKLGWEERPLLLLMSHNRGPETT